MQKMITSAAKIASIQSLVENLAILFTFQFNIFTRYSNYIINASVILNKYIDTFFF